MGRCHSGGGGAFASQGVREAHAHTCARFSGLETTHTPHRRHDPFFAQVSELRRDLRAALSTLPLTSYAQQLQRAQLLERAGDWQAAVEGYLSIGTGVTKDVDALQTVRVAVNDIILTRCLTRCLMTVHTL